MNLPGKALVRKTLGRAAWRGAPCCFALSTGRAGSHTLTSLLNLSPQVRAFHEPAPQLLAETLDAFHHVWDDPDRFREVLIDAKSVDIGIARLRGKIYAETSNRMSFLAPVIAELFPRAMFIYLHRHPADVVRSGMRRGWYHNHPWDPYRMFPAMHDAASAAWPDWDSFAKTCWYWHSINEFCLKFIGSIAPERCLMLSFEELMDADSDAWMKIYGLLDVEPPHLYAVREVLSRRENEQKTGRFAAPSEWNDAQWEVMQRIVGQTAQKLGYTTRGKALVGAERRAGESRVPACSTRICDSDHVGGTNL
jgi:hypothetical protein